MTNRFRDFVKSRPLGVSLREDAVPAAPTNPDSKTTNKHHFDFLQRNLGIEDEDFAAALEGDSQQLWKVPDFASKWGFIVNGPCSATVVKRPDGSYDVTFQLKQKKLMSPKSFFYPVQQGKAPMYYDGPVEDRTEIMDEESLIDLMVGSMGKMRQMGGGMPGGAPPGGAPPMMGGM